MPKFIQVGDFRDLIPQIQDKSLVIDRILYKGDKVKVFHEEAGSLWKTSNKSLSKDGRVFYVDMENGTTVYLEPTQEIQLFFDGEVEKDGSFGSYDDIHDLTLDEVAEIVRKRKEEASEPVKEEEDEIY